MTGTKNAGVAGTFVVVDAIDVPTAGARRLYPAVPQQPGTAITLAGRDSKLLVANYGLGAPAPAVLDVGDLMTHARSAAATSAVLYGRDGQDGETVLQLPDRSPRSRCSPGTVSVDVGRRRGDLRLNYTHTGLTRVLVTGGGRAPLLLLIGTDQDGAEFWRQDTAAGTGARPRAPALRTASRLRGSTLALTGDTADAGDGRRCGRQRAVARDHLERPAGYTVARRADGSLRGRCPAPAPVTLPALTQLAARAETPEAQPGFDDSRAGRWPTR